MAENVSVLTEGIIEVTLDQSGLNLMEICEKENEDLFKQGLSDGYATGVVSLSNGARGKINIQIQTVMQMSDGFYKKNSNDLVPVEPGEDYYQNVFLRISILMMNFVASKEDNWAIFGHVKNQESEIIIPIIILYSPLLQKCFYSIKRKADTVLLDPMSLGFSIN